MSFSEFQSLWLNFVKMNGNYFWTSLSLLLFAFIFLVIGILRIVEISDFRFRPAKKWALIVLHVLGCCLFSASTILLALDIHKYYQALLGSLFFSAIFALFPLQIYLAIQRKIRRSEPRKL